MSESRYRYLAALSTEEGRPLGQYPLSPDWYPAKEAARFRALRRAGDPSVSGQERIVPVWDPERGMPFLHSIEIPVGDTEAEGDVCVLPLSYFRSDVQAISGRLIKEGRLKEGDLFHYRILAFACPEEAVPSGLGSRTGWVVEEVPTSSVCGERSLPAYLRASQPVGESDAEDYPVFLPPAILEQAEALKTEALEKETGGILIGYLWRDTESPELFAEVTALVPAQYTIAETKKLTFTPETWDAVQTAIRLRNRNEIYLAWYHTHPSRFWCHCPPEAQRTCPLGQQFFSLDDGALHRTVFSRAFHVALVTGDRPHSEGGWEMTHALYGWRNGMIASRGFHLLEIRAEAGEQPPL